MKLDKNGAEKAPASQKGNASAWSSMFSGAYVSVDELHGFKAAIERFIRITPGIARERISNSMGLDFDLNKNVLWSDVCKSVGSPALIFPLSVKEWPGNAAIIFRDQAVYYMVEFMMGGRKSPGGIKIEREHFTAFEKEITGAVADIFTDAMRSAFVKVYPSNFTRGRCESEPIYISAWGKDEHVVWLKINLQDKEGRGGIIDIVFPHSSLHNDFMTKPVNSYLLEDSVYTRKMLEKMVDDVEVNVRVEMNNISMTVEELAKMKVGDTITMNRIESDRAELVVSDFVIAKVELGQLNGNLAGHIVDL